jgi:hypothetical protein
MTLTTKRGKSQAAGKRRPGKPRGVLSSTTALAAGPLSYPAELQKESNWCWAAVGSCTDRFYKGTKEQCDVACIQYPSCDCCQDGDPCNNPSQLDEVLGALGRMQNWDEGYAAKNDLSSELTGGRVVAARIGWNRGGGHFIALVGYDSQSDIVSVEDPASGSHQMPFDELRDHYLGKGSWTHTYWTKR